VLRPRDALDARDAPAAGIPVAPLRRLREARARAAASVNLLFLKGRLLYKLENFNDAYLALADAAHRDETAALAWYGPAAERARKLRKRRRAR
jgi:hypothetical protein